MTTDINLLLEKMNLINNEISSLNQDIKKLLKQEQRPPSCNFCDSSFIYYRKKTGDLMCRKCGRVSHPKNIE